MGDMTCIKVSKEIYELYQELERLEDVLIFSVFYPFSRAFDSHHLLPGFEVGKRYFEIQMNPADELKVVEFYGWREEGEVLNEKQIEELINELRQL